MSDQIRWGILSTASIGYRRVVPAMQASRNGVVTAVASRNLERAQEFAADLGIEHAYGSYDELLASDAVDAIYNPLPNSEHAEWAIKCAEAGKPMLCEKPLARDAAEAQTMVDAFAARGLLFAEAFMYRFHPQTERVRALLNDGAVGDVRAMKAAFTFPIRGEDNIRLSKPLAGGSLMDVGCYCINAMRLMIGEEPVEAVALAEVGAESGVDEAFSGVLRFPSGALGHFDSGLRSHRTHTYDIRGEAGRILVEQAFVVEADVAPVIRWWHGDDYQEITIPAVNQYTLMAEDFADALLKGRAPRYAPADAVANMRVIDLLKAAAGVA